MNTPIIKHHVFREAERHLASMIASHKDRVNDLRSATIMDELHETASQTELNRVADIELLDRFGEQIERIDGQLALLGRFDPHHAMDVVDPGAVVRTDKRNFLIGPSIEEFQVDGHDFQGLTTDAPLFKVLQGARKGDKVVFQGTEYTVLDVR